MISSLNSLQALVLTSTTNERSAEEPTVTISLDTLTALVEVLESAESFIYGEHRKDTAVPFMHLLGSLRAFGISDPQKI